MKAVWQRNGVVAHGVGQSVDILFPPGPRALHPVADLQMLQDLSLARRAVCSVTSRCLLQLEVAPHAPGAS